MTPIPKCNPQSPRSGLGAAITELRRQKNWTQIELSERLGIAQQTLSGWETGEVDLPVSRLTTIAEVFGITVAELFKP